MNGTTAEHNGSKVKKVALGPVEATGRVALLDRFNPRFLVVLSRAIMALGTPVVAYLITQGPSLSGGTIDPISFCNVLFVGNLCAAFVVSGRFGMRNIIADLGQTSTRTRIRLVLMGAGASAVSGLIFMALESTTVANAVLLGRLGPVFYAFLGAMLLAFPIRRAEWLGFAFIGLGVVATVFTGSGFALSKGDYLIIASSVFYAITTWLSKGISKECSLRAMVFARNVVSSFVFFGIAVYLFGTHHFEDVFSGDLWTVMLIYALVIVVTSQFTWYSAISRLDPASVAKWTVLAPVLGVIYAYFINDQVPTMTQIVGLALVSVGILVASFRGSHERRPKNSSDGAENGLAAN